MNRKYHDHGEQKGAIRRFKTIYTQINQFDEDTQKFLKNLNKKFNKTTNSTIIQIFVKLTTK